MMGDESWIQNASKETWRYAEVPLGKISAAKNVYSNNY